MPYRSPFHKYARVPRPTQASRKCKPLDNAMQVGNGAAVAAISPATLGCENRNALSLVFAGSDKIEDALSDGS